MSERVYIPYHPVNSDDPPKMMQWRLKMSDNPWTQWCGTRVNEYDRAAFEFRVPAPEEDDAEWEDVPLGGISSAGDRKSFKGGEFCDVREFEVGRRVLNDCLRVRRRKAVEPQKPLSSEAVTTCPPDWRILAEGLRAVQSLIDESRGVTGLHLNGDEATWTDLRTGGRFEEWLHPFDKAIAKIDEVPSSSGEDSEKPLNTYLPYLLEKADKAIKGDQAKREQINAAKAVFAKRISEIMGVTE